MDHLEKISVAELQQALDEVEGKQPTKRLLAAIAYKNGVTQTELAGWYGVPRKTIYNWLMRLEARPLATAVQDEPRPGRPRKLTHDEQQKLYDTLHESPTESGLDAPDWTPEALQKHVRDTYQVEYSLPSCRRLLKEAGLS